MVSPRVRRRKLKQRVGSSGASLHAKTFAADGSLVFVGSFNFDPRSAELNTEMGFVIESAPLAREIETVFREDVPFDAYEVRLSEDGRLFWIERGEAVVRHETEPGTTLWRRVLVRILSLLPVERLL
jgi:putative cardiolipin synthase